MRKSKKTILILGGGYSSDATASILKIIFSHLKNNFNIIFSCFDNISNLKPNYIPIKRNISFLFDIYIKIVRRFLIFLGVDFSCLGWRKYYSFVITKIQNRKIDMVIASPGIYSKIGYQISFKKKCKFSLIYTDPFCENPFFKKLYKSRYKKEYIWQKKSSIIFYDADGIVPPINEFNYKKRKFFFPIPKPVINKKNLNNIILYGGNFYKGFRDNNGIESLSSRKEFSNYCFDVYSNIDYKSHDNIFYHHIVPHKKYIKILSRAQATIVIGNDTNVKYISSKYLLDISYRKIIIGINISKEYTLLKKYPFFIDSNDKDLVRKIESIKANDLNKFNPYKMFPERNPIKISKIILNDLLNCFNCKT